MTNLEKFLEVFGYEEKADNIDFQCLCPCIVEGSCEKCRHYNKKAKGCNIEKFWQSEYKEPKEIHLIPIGEKPKGREIAKTILRAQIDCDYKCSHGECLQDCENCRLSYLLGTNESHDNGLKLALKALENESKWVEVIEDIKADIDEESTKSFKYPNWERAKALEWAMDVIDKHTEELM